MSKVKWAKIGDGWYGDHIHYTFTVRPHGELWNYTVHPIQLGQKDMMGNADTPEEGRHLAERVMNMLEALKGAYISQ